MHPLRFRITALLLLLLLLPVLPLTGCDKSIPPMTEYLASALDAELLVDTGDITYRATVHLGAANRNAARDCEIVLLSPDALCGITVTRKDGVESVTRGEIETAYMGDGAAFLAADLLSPAHVVGREITEENGRSCLCFRCADGRTVTVDAETGALCEIRREDVKATVVWCETRERGQK